MSVPGAAYVATVAGPPLVPGAPARVDAHAHAWIDPPDGVADDHALRLDDERRGTLGLRAYADAAAPRRAGLIDCQPPGAGRDARRLAALSGASEVAIACVTGFHLARYYPHGRPAGGEGAADAWVRELDEGLAELPERRAAALKAAHDGGPVVGGDDAIRWEAAVAAQRRTGACLLVHTERGARVVELLAWLVDQGVAAERVYLCHLDKRADLALHRELAQAGVLLGYDTFVHARYLPEERAWPLLHAMLEAGHGPSIAIGLDLALATDWDAGADGVGGPAALVTQVERRLCDDGVDDEMVASLLGGAVLARFARTVRAAGEQGA